MEIINKKITGNFGIFLYKILGDILTVLLVALALLILSESLMPGLVSVYLSFTRLILAVFAVLASMIYLGKINNLSFDRKKEKTAFWSGLMFFFAVLTINALLKFSVWEIAIIATTSIFLIYYLSEKFFANSKKKS
jgi:hypothetical protein